MGRLTFRKRRAPIGAVPTARFGVRHGDIGLVTTLAHEDVREARLLDAPDDEYLTRIATSRDVGWGLRVEGLLPEAVRGSQIITRFIPIGHTPRDGHAGGSELFDKPLSELMPSGAFIALPKVIPASRDYLRVSTYDADVLPMNSLLVIEKDTVLTFGWLSSRAFWLWTQVVKANIPTATTYTAYVNFPAPLLGKKDRNRLEVAADTVLRARSHLMNGGIDELYSTWPDQLAWAHSELDVIVEELLGISADADDTAVINTLVARYEEVAA